MEKYRKPLIDYLLADTELMALLPANKPWFKKQTGTADKQWSVIPVQGGPLDNTPYLTIRFDVESRRGYNLIDTFFLIRCYNGMDKTYYDIDKIMSRLKALLHRHVFTFEDAGVVNVETLYELTSGELEDEGWQQRYREQQYRLMNI